MSDLDIVVEVSKLARMFALRVFYRRFISNIFGGILLAVVTGMLTSFLLIIICYAAYMSLIRHGLDADAAVLTVGGVITTVTLLCAAFTIHFIRKLRNASLPPNINDVPKIAKSFADGFSEAGNR